MDRLALEPFLPSPASDNLRRSQSVERCLVRLKADTTLPGPLNADTTKRKDVAHDLHSDPGQTPYAMPPLFTQASALEVDHVQLPSLQRPVAEAPAPFVGGVGNSSTPSLVSDTSANCFEVHV